MARTKTADRDMTQGGIFRALLLFSLPLLAGNFFQQCYNTVDSIVLGNFVGKAALAAVGTTTPIINTLIGLFLGLSAGIGVVISQFYGAKEEEKVGQAVQTSLLLVLLLCGVFTAVGIAMVPGMLRLMATPADVFPQAARYLRIYFAGVSGLMLYNLGAGILRAVGDARRPLYFLLFSAGVNTGLDLLFVAVFHWGIAGAAIATVAAQVLSAGMVLGVLTRSRGCGCTGGFFGTSSWWGCPRPCSWPSPPSPMCLCSPMSTASPPPAWPGGRPIRRSTPSSSCP